MKLASTVNCKFNLFCGFYDLIFLMLLLGEYCSFLLLINSGHIGSCILSYWVLKKYDSCTQAKKYFFFAAQCYIYSFRMRNVLCLQCTVRVYFILGLRVYLDSIIDHCQYKLFSQTFAFDATGICHDAIMIALFMLCL